MQVRILKIFTILLALPLFQNCGEAMRAIGEGSSSTIEGSQTEFINPEEIFEQPSFDR